MKKLTLVMALMLAVAASNAQGLRVGLAGGFNSTWLFDKNTSDAGDNLDYKSSFGGQVGVSALYNFKENIGVSLDILYNGVNQKYTNRQTILGQETTFETEASLSTIALPLLFRYTGEKGPYFEVGPEFDIINSGTYSLDGASTDFPDGKLNGMSIAAVIGFGVDIKASEQLTITTGLRFAWGLGDVYKDDGSSNYEPTNTAVGGLHLGVAYNLGKK